MWELILETIDTLLAPGREAFDLGILQMAARSALVYVVAIVLVRLANKRFMGRNSAFDLLLGIMLGSILSRGITGQAPMAPCIAAGAVLLGLHWLMAAVAVRASPFARLIKGQPRRLIEDGEINWKAMRKSHLGEHDLVEAMRIHGQTTDPNDIAVACLERNGDISIVRKKDQPRTVEVKVEEGVQVVRVELSP